MQFVKNIILGAGLTGLTAACSLKKNFLLFEKNSYVGVEPRAHWIQFTHVHVLNHSGR